MEGEHTQLGMGEIAKMILIALIIIALFIVVMKVLRII
jgi:hypothetical protein